MFHLHQSDSIISVSQSDTLINVYVTTCTLLSVQHYFFCLTFLCLCFSVQFLLMCSRDNRVCFSYFVCLRVFAMQKLSGKASDKSFVCLEAFHFEHAGRNGDVQRPNESSVLSEAAIWLASSWSEFNRTNRQVLQRGDASGGRGLGITEVSNRKWYLKINQTEWFSFVEVTDQSPSESHEGPASLLNAVLMRQISPNWTGYCEKTVYWKKTFKVLTIF